VENAVEQPHHTAHSHGNGHGPEAERIGRYIVQNQEAHNHGSQRHHTFNGQINATHENDERSPHAKHDGNRGRVQQPDEVAEGEEITVEQADENAQRKQHHDRRPSAPMPKEISV